ncbi:hypothetical protein COP1_006637 [Malus domestica]
MGFLGPPVLMGKKDCLIDLSLVAKLRRIAVRFLFTKCMAFLTWHARFTQKSDPTGRAKTMFVGEISRGECFLSDEHTAPREVWRRLMLFCRAPALLAGLSGKAEREGQS